MPSFHGKFVWYELMTTDAAHAADFYAHVIGWNAKDGGIEGFPYTIFGVGAAGVAGLMTLPKEACDAGAKPGWIGYIGVNDVDGSAAEIVRLGGAIHRAAEDIPGDGRFAVVADLQGAAFVIFKPFPAEGAPQPAPYTPGYGGWHELRAVEWEAAFSFYSELFGWTKADPFDMGPMGIYQLFATGNDPVGGMMTRMDKTAPPAWLYYFSVASIEAAAARVTASNGQIVNGPHEVPGGGWIVQCLDPQGAKFALVGPRN